MRTGVSCVKPPGHSRLPSRSEATPAMSPRTAANLAPARETRRSRTGFPAADPSHPVSIQLSGGANAGARVRRSRAARGAVPGAAGQGVGRRAAVGRPVPPASRPRHAGLAAPRDRSRRCRSRPVPRVPHITPMRGAVADSHSRRDLACACRRGASSRGVGDDDSTPERVGRTSAVGGWEAVRGDGVGCLPDECAQARDLTRRPTSTLMMIMSQHVRVSMAISTTDTNRPGTRCGSQLDRDASTREVLSDSIRRVVDVPEVACRRALECHGRRRQFSGRRAVPRCAGGGRPAPRHGIAPIAR